MSKHMKWIVVMMIIAVFGFAGIGSVSAAEKSVSGSGGKVTLKTAAVQNTEPEYMPNAVLVMFKQTKQQTKKGAQKKLTLEEDAAEDIEIEEETEAEDAAVTEKDGWHFDAKEDEITVIHLLCVLPEYYGRGFAKEMIRHAAKLSRSIGRKVIRLDVIKGNERAKNLYLSEGFEFIGEYQVFYEDTGLADFWMFERLL